MAWGRGSTRQWRVLRERILRRDPTCSLGLEGCTGRSTQVDHIVNVQAGGTHHPSNLRGVCKRCHLVKTKAEAAEGRRRSAETSHEPDAHPGFISPDA